MLLAILVSVLPNLPLSLWHQEKRDLFGVTRFFGSKTVISHSFEGNENNDLRRALECAI